MYKEQVKKGKDFNAFTGVDRSIVVKLIEFFMIYGLYQLFWLSLKLMTDFFVLHPESH